MLQLWPWCSGAGLMGRYLTVLWAQRCTAVRDRTAVLLASCTRGRRVAEPVSGHACYSAVLRAASRRVVRDTAVRLSRATDALAVRHRALPLLLGIFRQRVWLVEAL
eukprot:scaffold14093_cov107-Isochrysis_galbana.AAC.1